MTRCQGGFRFLASVAAVCSTSLVSILATQSSGQVQPGPPRPPIGGAPGVATPLPPRDVQAQAPTGTGVIGGRVTRSDTGTAIVRATVTLSGPGVETRTTLSDENGRYAFSGLLAFDVGVSYYVEASRTGFVTRGFAQQGPTFPGLEISLTAGQVVNNVDLVLPAAAVIEGRVFDQFGDPVAGASVQPMRGHYESLERRPLVDPTAGALTDDLGRFRLYGLESGSYYVGVVAPPPRRPGEIPVLAVSLNQPGAIVTYYPGTAIASEAKPVVLAPGQELGIAVPLAALQLASIAGIATSSAGNALSASVSLSGDSSRGNQLRADGTFAFPVLPPGEYEVTVIAPELQEAASARVVLNGADVTLTLVTSPSGRLQGRVRFDDGAIPAELRPENVRISVTPTDTVSRLLSSSVTGQLRSDWSFEVDGVHGTGLIRPTFLSASDARQRSADLATVASQPLPGSPWVLKAVLRDGVDVTDTPLAFQGSNVDGLDVILTRKIVTVSGTVTDNRGTPRQNVMVTVFADDPQRWGPRTRHVASARSDNAGEYRVRGLPPGRYVAIAVDHWDPFDYQNPEILAQLHARATALALREGEARVLHLKLLEP